MKKLSQLFIVVVAVSLLSCGDDEGVKSSEKKLSIVGSYSGQYIYVIIDSLGHDIESFSQPISVRFTATNCIIAPFENAPDSLGILIDYQSDYSLTDSTVEFEVWEIEFTRPVNRLDAYIYPHGPFRDQLTRDQLSMTQRSAFDYGSIFEVRFELERWD